MNYQETLNNIRGMAPDLARHILKVTWMKVAKTQNTATLEEQEHALRYINQDDLEDKLQEIKEWSEVAPEYVINIYAQVDAWRGSMRAASSEDREAAPMLHATVTRSFADGITDSMTEPDTASGGGAA